MAHDDHARSTAVHNKASESERSFHAQTISVDRKAAIISKPKIAVAQQDEARLQQEASHLERIAGMERKLFDLLTALISNGTIFHEGYIMDAGANNGRTTVLLKKMFVNRTVLAVDPLRMNIRKILSTADKSIQAVRGFLGASPSTLSYSSDAEKKVGQQIGKISLWENFMTKNLTQNVEVYTVDSERKA